jgi:hypothetical protein
MGDTGLLSVVYLLLKERTVVGIELAPEMQDGVILAGFNGDAH